MPFTFKKEPNPTGLSAVTETYPVTNIKLKGQIVGCITPPGYRDSESLWTIRFMVKCEAEKCGWKWISLASKPPTEDCARLFVNRMFDKIMKKYDLRSDTYTEVE